MQRKIRHYIILGLGWTFIVLGILGLFLPVLQGVLFLCVGAIMLSSVSPRMRLLIMRLGQRYPRFRIALNASKAKARELRARLRFYRPKRSGEG